MMNVWNKIVYRKKKSLERVIGGKVFVYCGRLFMILVFRRL